MSANIKQFSSQIDQYQQNQMSVNNQGQLFQQLNNEKENHQYETRNSMEAETFWSSIWRERKEHHKDAE